MATYIDQALVGDERLLHRGHVSLWSLWHLIFFGVLLLPLFGLGLLLLVAAYIKFKSTELAVTTKRLIVKHGFIRRATMELNIHKVESIHVEQGVVARMLNFGTLVISGTGTAHAPLVGIADPMAFRRAFVEAQDADQAHPARAPARAA
jgi:uncharacterized membrane protein YdbT with pleckstrin-like domain